jgi:hypothetical protein
MRLRPVCTIAAAAVLALSLGACGDKVAKITHGETEASYLDVGGLKYQVQISRALNPRDVEDHGYLIGLGPGDQQLTSQETWFGVFMRVQNPTNQPRPTASDYTITDTEGTVFRPLPLTAVNLFAYRPGTLGPSGITPIPGSAPAEGPIQGSLLLFKIPFANLENRPLELEIRNPQAPQESASVALDI